MVSQVFVLIVIGYSSIHSSVVETKELSWHSSLSDCRVVLNAEQTRGRGVFYNENLVCLPVQDRAMAVKAKRKGRYDYPRRHGTLNVVK